MPIALRWGSGYFRLAFLACSFVVNGFDRGVNSRPTYLKSSHRSTILGIRVYSTRCSGVRKLTTMRPAGMPERASQKREVKLRASRSALSCDAEQMSIAPVSLEKSRDWREIGRLERLQRKKRTLLGSASAP